MCVAKCDLEGFLYTGTSSSEYMHNVSSSAFGQMSTYSNSVRNMDDVITKFYRRVVKIKIEANINKLVQSKAVLLPVLMGHNSWVLMGHNI